ncbi:NAD-dependent epimerase/dehydratase family protein [Merismopedia glauca]|uniref:Epimerase n=1 Tax=Merismopedia glauca CCAP 1448/3 TaxID=1296344 RepID=A0A2T1C5Y6_9CYAN|nr:NAD-dependent epimerase/dehydratase family protein [Merismopedia glauca]PSB03695.1 epimerase [Merismopedia glauca CCAP 1448/3]
MKALVTGASGFTGSHLVKALEKRGIEVVGLVRKSSNLSNLDNCSVKLVYGDLGDRPSITEAMTGVDWVFHTAAYVEIGLVDAVKMQLVNVEGTRNVMELSKQLGVQKVVHFSTIGIFGDTQGRVINETFIREQKNFSSAYDSTKLAAQEIVDKLAGEGLPVVSLLPSGIFGADDPHFGPVLRQYLSGKLPVWGGGDRITGIVHVDDLAEAAILAAIKGKSGEKYIISAGELSLKEMFAFLSAQTGIPVPKEIPPIMLRIAGNILDPIGRLFNWQPPISKERVHYIYDRCVRVDATKAKTQLGWQPRNVTQTLTEISNTILADLKP